MEGKAEEARGPAHGDAKSIPLRSRFSWSEDEEEMPKV